MKDDGFGNNSNYENTVYTIINKIIKSIVMSLKINEIFLFGSGRYCEDFLSNIDIDIGGIFDNDFRRWGHYKRKYHTEPGKSER